MSSPRVVAVVLNWNNYADTAACLRSLQMLEYDALKIVVVDNGSTDRSGDRIDEEFSAVPVLFTGENRGFAGGMNAGIKWALDAGAEYVWLLNNDTVYEEPDVLDVLVGHMQSNQGIGLLTPQINLYPDTDSLWFKRGVLDDRTYNAVHHRNTPIPDFRLSRPDLSRFTDGMFVYNDFVPQCCALVPAEVFEQVSLIPERYFLYYEDVAFANRLQEAGYQLVTATDTTVYHKESASSDGGATSAYYNERNRILMACDDDGINLQFVLLTVWRLALTIGVSLLRRNLDVVRAVLRGLWDGLRRVDGRGPYP